MRSLQAFVRVLLVQMRGRWCLVHFSGLRGAVFCDYMGL